MKTKARLSVGFSACAILIFGNVWAQEIFEGDTGAEDFSDGWEADPGSEAFVEESSAVTSEPQKDQDVDVSYFYDQLAPYGEWVWVAEHGWVWRPNGVWEDWRPYTYGRWVLTNSGWTWSSYFPWGWATFHYGRWAMLNHFGWVWVPGSVWAPAWVMWRYSGSYIGWAPLLAGYDYWYGWAYYPLYYSNWSFLSWGYFYHEHPYRYFVPRDRLKHTFQRTYYPRACRDRSSGRCVRGPSQSVYKKYINQPIRPRNIHNVAQDRKGSWKDKNVLGVQGDSLHIYRPRPVKSAVPQASPPTKYPGRLSGPRDLGEIRSLPSPKYQPKALPRSDQQLPPSRIQRQERENRLPGKTIHPTPPKTQIPSLPSQKSPAFSRPPTLHREERPTTQPPVRPNTFNRPTSPIIPSSPPSFRTPPKSHTPSVAPSPQSNSYSKPAYKRDSSSSTGSNSNSYSKPSGRPESNSPSISIPKPTPQSNSSGSSSGSSLKKRR